MHSSYKCHGQSWFYRSALSLTNLATILQGLDVKQYEHKYYIIILNAQPTYKFDICMSSGRRLGPRLCYVSENTSLGSKKFCESRNFLYLM
jgi:hypothetical protein